MKTHSFQDETMMIGEPRALSKSGFAAKIGVSPGRVSQMIAQGLPVETGGKIDVARGRMWISDNVSLARSKAQPQSAFGFTEEKQQHSLTTEKARLAKEQADAAELRNSVTRRDLVKAADVEREWSGILRKVRSSILAVPSRVRQQLAHLTAHDAAVIDAEIRSVLEELARDQ